MQLLDRYDFMRLYPVRFYETRQHIGHIAIPFSGITLGIVDDRAAHFGKQIDFPLIKISMEEERTGCQKAGIEQVLNGSPFISPYVIRLLHFIWRFKDMGCELDIIFVS